MTNDRFIILLTKELCEQLTETEREELFSILKDNPRYRDQRELFKAYWEKDRNEYQASSALFKKVQEKIIAEETANQTPEQPFLTDTPIQTPGQPSPTGTPIQPSGTPRLFPAPPSHCTPNIHPPPAATTSAASGTAPQPPLSSPSAGSPTIIHHPIPPAKRLQPAGSRPQPGQPKKTS
ncbi:hypothetical protein ACQ86N_36200 [Puia sp. P3]|uniref:hypothetical protein n=1 Tax=Puia sp. P3 TaxID=3423952 RepID=UPI003D66DA05